MRLFLPLAAAALLLSIPTRGGAEVADASANGFTVKLTLNVQASPDDVYRKLVHNIGDWWDGSHSFSGDAHNLTIEEKPGGCFCEKLSGSGGARHMEVVYFAPGKQLVLSGALGPMQSLAATGSMAIKFTPVVSEAKEASTKLEVAYTVVGYLPAGMNTWAAPVDGVLKLQFARLKNYVERGDPAPAK